VDLNTLWRVAESARSERRLSPADTAFVRDVVPMELEAFPRLNLPKTIRHPTGFSISGAPVGTFLRSALLIAGQAALGDRYAGSPFYESVERETWPSGSCGRISTMAIPGEPTAASNARSPSTPSWRPARFDISTAPSWQRNCFSSFVLAGGDSRNRPTRNLTRWALGRAAN